MKNLFSLCAVSIVCVLMFSSCGQESEMFKNMTQKPTDSAKDDVLGSFAYAEMFSNFSNIEVSITSSEGNGKYCAVFTEYPYNEDMELVIEPILRGHTPINTKISVPKGAEKLYVLSDFDVMEYPVGDLYISDSEISTKSMTRAAAMPSNEFDALKKYIVNEKFPQAKNAIFGEDLYKCTDLYADVSEGQQVSVSITFLHSDWYKSGSFPGYVWFYIYKGENPRIEDCQFYGYKRSTGLTYPKESFDYIKTHPTEDFLIGNATTMNDEITLDVKLQPGEKMGFVWHGNLGWRFTTPSLNTLPYTKETGKHPKNLVWPDDDPIGKTITKDGMDFTITQNVFGGALMHIYYEGTEYNVVGFENRLPGQTITVEGSYTSGVYDGDFNDFMFLVKTTPEYIAPAEELHGPDMTTTITESGIWIFEDNYPNRGDYDFNDVVVSYEKKQTKPGEVEITCHLLACGCGFKNEFGLLVLDDINDSNSWRTPVKQQPVWKGITGNMNVGGEEVDLSKCEAITIVLQCQDIYHLQPYLDNGQGHGICTLQNYNTGDCPYILQIPNEQHSNFCWTREGIALTTAYSWGKARACDWYANPLEDYLVVKIKK